MGDRHHSAWVDFGREIRQHRTQAGLSLDDVASHLTITGGMLSKIERAARPAKRDTAEQLDAYFGTEGAILRTWHASTKQAVDPEWFRRLGEAEAKAAAISAFHTSLVPGALQTEDYARTVLTLGRPMATPKDIDEWLAYRMRRAERLLQPGDPALTMVVPIGVLRTPMGGPKVMRAQLAHMADLAESGAVRLLILPDGEGTTVGASVGSFRLIDMQDHRRIAYVESAGTDSVVDAPRQVQRFVLIIGTLTAWAADPKDSLRIVKEIANDG